MVFTGRDEDVTVSVGGDASGLNNALDGAIQKLGSLRNAVGLAGAALGALAAGGLAAATSAAADFEEQMVEVEKVTSPEIAAEMSDRIREMAAEMPVAQENLAGIAAQAGRFGVEGSENIERFTESVAQMAVATDLTEEEAGEAFARMTTLMDEPIDNIQNLGDAVNGLSNNMATSASEITNAATRSSGTLSQLGLQSEQILALNATMNEVSASSRIAGTRLRRFAQEMMDPKKAEDLASALGMTAQEFRSMREDDPSALMERMVATFGEGGDAADELRTTLSTTSRQALASLAQNTEGWANAQEIANEQMGEGTSLQEEYAAAADTFNNKVQVLKNRVRNAAIAVGEDLLPVMTDLVEAVTGAFDAFDGLNDSFDGINPGTIALVSTAIGGLATALWAFAPAAAAAAASVAAIAAPALAVAGVIAALWVAWEENLLGIQEITADVVDAVTGWFEENRASIEAAMDGVMAVLSAVANNLRNILLPAARFVFERVLLPIFRRVAGAIERNLGPVLEELGPTFQTIAAGAELAGNKLQTVWQTIGPVVGPIVETLAGLIGDTLGFALDQLADGLLFLMNLIQGDFEAALGNLTDFLSRPLEAALNVGHVVLESIRDGISAAVDWITSNGVDLMVDAFNFIAGTEEGGGLPQLLVDGISNGFTAIAQWIGSVDAIGWIADLGARVRRAIEEAIKDAIDFGPGDVRTEDEQSAAEQGVVNATRGTALAGAATGGFVERGGMLNVHAGEQVVQAAQVTDRGEVEAGGGADPRTIARAVQSALSGAGFRVETGDEQLDQLIADEAELVFDGRESQTFDRLRRNGVID